MRLERPHRCREKAYPVVHDGHVGAVVLVEVGHDGPGRPSLGKLRGNEVVVPVWVAPRTDTEPVCSEPSMYRFTTARSVIPSLSKSPGSAAIGLARLGGAPRMSCRAGRSPWHTAACAVVTPCRPRRRKATLR